MLQFPLGQPVEHSLPIRVSGGIPPYESGIEGCPDWVTLFPDQGIIAGTAPVAASGMTFFCTYLVTESDPGFRPQRSVSYGLRLFVGNPNPLSLASPGKQRLVVGAFHDEALPAAAGRVAPHTYTFSCASGSLPPGMGFAPRTRRFAGTPTARFRDSCSYSVTDSAQPAETVSQAVEVEVTGGATPLELTRVFETVADSKLTLKIGRRSQTEFRMAAGGVAPYTYEVVDCTLPAGLAFHGSTRILSGTPNAEYRGPSCTYRVTDSSSPPESVSLPFVLTVEPFEANAWRFRTRTVEPGGPCVLPGGAVTVATLPAAHGGQGTEGYALPGAPHPLRTGRLLSFNPSNRVSTYANPEAPPVLGTPDTYRYLVGTAADVNAENAEDAFCLDVRYDPGADVCPGNPAADPPILPSHYIHIRLRVRDDAFWDESVGEYRCPDTTAPTPRSGTQGSSSNPVHEALGPVHARRAAAAAHAAVRDHVRGWSPGAEQASFAIAPEVGLASLSGQSEGFDYSGTSESASVGAETGAGAWQAGVVASLTRTELRYRAEAALAERGYRTGDHDTELASLHPFAAWHAPSGGHIWASLGTGAGSLSHRDDLGFPSWSRSDLRLFAYAAGASVPVADVLSGELEAETSIESFALDIEGGGRISSSLPTLQGRDWRAGLAWSAPVYGAPSVSMAYRRLTGDGLAGGRLEARGSVSVEGMFDPRLTLTGSAEGSLGVGEYEHDSWGLAGGVRFAPGETIRGFGLEFDTRLASPDERGSADVGMRGEVGYGLSGGPFFGTLRPHVGLIRYSGDGSLRRSLGVDLRDTPSSGAKLEVYDRTRDGLRALEFTLNHRF